MSKFIDIPKLQEFSIVDFLARLGHHPVRKLGKEYFYHSMLRETRKQTPSLTVWDSGNRWIDRGGAGISGHSGGGIVQLGQALWPGLTFVEVLDKIRQVCELPAELIENYVPLQQLRDEKEEAGFGFELVRTQPVGTNYVLTKYLDARGILDTAKGRMSEIYYRQKGSAENARVFYAVGWKNEHNSWEFSNAKGFKSSIGPKGVSYIPGSPVHAVLFEGYMDYLSWLTEQNESKKPTIVILNSIAMLNRVIDNIKAFIKVDIYFDRDGPGIKATLDLMEKVPQAKDGSHLYEGFKDYNEKIKTDLAKVHSAPATDFDDNRYNNNKPKR